MIDLNFKSIEISKDLLFCPSAYDNLLIHIFLLSFLFKVILFLSINCLILFIHSSFKYILASSQKIKILKCFYCLCLAFFLIANYLLYLNFKPSFLLPFHSSVISDV